MPARPGPLLVCQNCVTDAELKAILEHDLGDVEDEEHCSYCGACPAALLDTLVDAVTGVFEREYTDPANELPYETAEGGYQGVFYDGYDMVQDMDSWTDNDDLREDVADALAGTAWCQRHYFSLTPQDTLRFGWSGFANAVKHRARYVFLLDRAVDEHGVDDTIPPGAMLDALGKLFTEYLTIRALAAGTLLFRARVHKREDILTSAGDLGPPARELARMSNRMSPAGIPMFYGAFDKVTALVETFDPRRDGNVVVSIAAFQTVKPLRILDLTALPDMPSQFDEDNWHMRAPIGFLHEFVEDLTKPVARDGYEHVEYVPTQVVTEYVRHHFTDLDGNRLNGLAYRSARDGGNVAIVLFIDATECGPRIAKPGEWLPSAVLLLESVEVVDPRVRSG